MQGVMSRSDRARRNQPRLIAVVGNQDLGVDSGRGQDRITRNSVAAAS
jgi:hypothetical protein